MIQKKVAVPLGKFQPWKSEEQVIFQQHACKLYLTIRGFSLVVQISVAAKKRLRVNLLLEDFFPYFIVLKNSDKD